VAQKMKRRASKNTVTESAPPVHHTAAEMRDIYQKNKKSIANYQEAMEGIKSLRDVTKTSTKVVTAFNKDSLRQYLQNIGSNEKNLRNLSRYLYYRCHPYYRLIMYNANMFCLEARSVIPEYDLIKGGDANKMLKSYQETIDVLDRMNLQYEMLKAYVTCFREDVFYGCAYYDDTGLFILPLDPDYCKISGVYNTGDFSFHMDMSYFRSRQTILEMWGEPFTSMYSAYESDTTAGKWQPMPDEYAVCFKARAEDWETVVPVFSGLLSGIINLIDLDDLQAIADEQDIYKMIWLELETITGSEDVDDWRVSPDIVIEYFNRMINEALPEYTSAAIVPGKLDQISFNNDKATDTNKIATSTETLFNSSGGAQILNSKSITGTTAFTAAVQADTEMAISMLLPQTQSWVNRFLSYWVSSPAKVKFFEVSAYTKNELKKNLLEAAQYGLPTKLAYNNLNQFSEKDTLSLNFLEEEVLHLSDKLIPLQSSYTQSGNENDSDSESQVKDPDELTDDGEASREKADKANE
jgi:hypothetical protein